MGDAPRHRFATPQFSGQDAERPERHAHAEHGHDSQIIVPHAPSCGQSRNSDSTRHSPLAGSRRRSCASCNCRAVSGPESASG
ncbi:hypothetical protein B1F69_24425 [Pseudomonas syringae]|nr:hypothetical protein B1F69_24425 [Pseudomonas syringae]